MAGKCAKPGRNMVDPGSRGKDEIIARCITALGPLQGYVAHESGSELAHSECAWIIVEVLLSWMKNNAGCFFIIKIV